MKQKFVEKCCAGCEHAAIRIAREELAPLALNAYPEAYIEFKNTLKLLVYAKDSHMQQAHITDMFSESARKDLASSVYHAAKQLLGTTH